MSASRTEEHIMFQFIFSWLLQIPGYQITLKIMTLRNANRAIKIHDI